MTGGKPGRAPFGVGRVFGYALELFVRNALILALLIGPQLYVFYYLFVGPVLIGYMATVDTSEPTQLEDIANFLTWMLNGAVLLMTLFAATILFNILLTASAVGTFAARGKGLKAILVAAWLSPLRWFAQICGFHLALLVIFAPLAGIVYLVTSFHPATEGIVRTFALWSVALAIIARTAPLLPLLVIEKCGWRSFRLSFEITKGYGFAIFAVLEATYLIHLFADMLLTVAKDAVSDSLATEQTSPLLVAGWVVSESLPIVLNACVLFAIFARLVEIHDERRAHQLENAFD